MDKKHQKKIKQIINKNKHLHLGEVPLKSGQGKLYTASEAEAERKRRKEAEEKVIINNSFLKPDKVPTKEQYAADILLKMADSLDEERLTMQLQCMRFIIGPDLEFPMKQLQKLFAWVDLQRHPKTGQLCANKEQYRVFIFVGDAYEETLTDRKSIIYLMWENKPEPEIKRDDKGSPIALVNNWEYLFDPELEYYEQEPLTPELLKAKSG